MQGLLFDCHLLRADITIGPLVVDALRPLTDAPLDTHLCAPTLTPSLTAPAPATPSAWEQSGMHRDAWQPEQGSAAMH
jgi:hypothetical protein